jgi:quercetin dioxygenase-like cupin family protein
VSQHGPVRDGDSFESLGLVPSGWDAGRGQRFGRHSHPMAKVLVCRSGSIRFTLEPSGEAWDLEPGDWIELAPGQDHTAVAGPAGVRCEEAFRGR